MLPDSYESLDWFFEDSFQPLMRPRGRFDSFRWIVWYGYEGEVGAQFGPDALFIIDKSEANDVDTWVHEFVEAAVSGVVTNVLELRPFMDMPVYMFDERVGRWIVCFCHLLASLTTGQGWWNDEDDYCTMEADDVWPCIESSLSLIKNSWWRRSVVRLCRWRDRVRGLFQRRRNIGVDAFAAGHSLPSATRSTSCAATAASDN